MSRPRVPFTLISKKKPSGRYYFSAVIFDFSSKKRKSIALGIEDDGSKRSKRQAEDLAEDLFGSGEKKIGSPFFEDYALDFWNWERSPYIRSRLIRDPKAISREHADNMDRNLRKWGSSLGKHRLNEINPGLLDDWATDLLADLSPQTAKHCINAVSGVLDYAHKRGLIPFNPVKLMLPLPARNRVHGVFTDLEARALLVPEDFGAVWGKPSSMHPNFDPRRHHILNILAAVTGARWNELAPLTREDFQNCGTYWALTISKSVGRLTGVKAGTKSGEGRVVPIALEVMALILPGLPSTGILFPGRGGSGPFTYRASRLALLGALKAVGIEGGDQKARKLGLHSWRHWFTTKARAAHVPDSVVMGITEHRTDKSKERYTHLGAVDFLTALPVQVGMVSTRPDEMDAMARIGR